MNSLISSIVAGVGKDVLSSISNNSEQPKLSKSQQLQRFDQRLDHAMQPEKAEFKEYLNCHFVNDIRGVEFLSQKTQDALLSDPELSAFVSKNGGRSGDISIERQGDNFVLKSQSGDEYKVAANSRLEGKVSQLYRLESIRQLAAIEPGTDLDRLVDLVFEKP